MNTNTNDFSKCKVGDKLWFDPLDCEVTVDDNSHPAFIRVQDTTRNSGFYQIIKTTGLMLNSHKQVLYFGKPQIIAPPEPPRLPDYKEGQWIAVWDDGFSAAPNIRRFLSVSSRGFVRTKCGTAWDNHCSLEELPAVLEKWGEK